MKTLILSLLFSSFVFARVANNVYTIPSSGSNIPIWGPLNLSGGAAAVTGKLPSINYYSPTTSRFTSCSSPPCTYNVPSNPTPLYLKVRIMGAGGGGAGSGTGGNGSGGAGGNTTFGTNMITAGGGGGGISPGVSVNSGGQNITNTVSGVTYLVPVNLYGSDNTPGGLISVNGSSYSAYGGPGVASIFGGTGTYYIGTPTQSPQAGSGSGGAGAGIISSSSSALAGGGGASGGYVEAIIYIFGSTFAYTIGSGGTAGTAGSSGNAGIAGASGQIIIEAYYQ